MSEHLKAKNLISEDERQEILLGIGPLASRILSDTRSLASGRLTRREQAELFASIEAWAIDIQTLAAPTEPASDGASVTRAAAA